MMYGNSVQTILFHMYFNSILGCKHR